MFPTPVNPLRIHKQVSAKTAAGSVQIHQALFPIQKLRDDFRQSCASELSSSSSTTPSRAAALQGRHGKTTQSLESPKRSCLLGAGGTGNVQEKTIGINNVE
jgi:hypothetical protein